MRRAWLLLVVVAAGIAAIVATCDGRHTDPAPAVSAPEPTQTATPQSATPRAARKRGVPGFGDGASEQPSERSKSVAARPAGVVATTFDPPDSRVATPRHGLRGRVVDLRRKPVAGAEVELVSVWLPSDVLAGLDMDPSMTSRVTTGADGTFDLPYHEGGDRELSVSCGDGREWRSRNLGDDRVHEVVLPDGPSALVVRVTSADDGSPVPVARVAVVRTSPDGLDSEMAVSRDDPPEPGTPDAAGVFRAGGLAAGPALLDVSAPGFAQSLARSVLVPVAGESTVDVALERGMTVRGQVVDATTGSGIAEVCVRLGRRGDRVPSDDACVEAWTDAGGRFVIGHVPLVPRTFVTFVARQFGRRDNDLADQEFLVGTADAAAAEVEVVVRLRPAARAQVRCLDADGKPVPGATVVAAVNETTDTERTTLGAAVMERGGRRAEAGPDGTFTLVGLSKGLWDLYAYASSESPGRLEPGVDPSRGTATLRLPRVVALTGRVVDAKGAPIANANVASYRAFFGSRMSVSCLTADDGRFRVPGFAADSPEVEVSVTPGKGAPAQTFNVRPGAAGTELRLR